MPQFSLAGLRLAAVLALLPLLAACSGSGPIADGGGDGTDPDTPPVGTYPAYETFDPAGYEAVPPTRVEIVHDVPARTMQGRVELPGQVSVPTNEGQPREVEGFRIQVGRSEDRATAESLRESVLSWWSSARGQSGAPSSLEVIVAYVQPHYRVRVGAFEFQDDADTALDFVRRKYSGAFVVPDRVTVR